MDHHGILAGRNRQAANLSSPNIALIAAVIAVSVELFRLLHTPWLDAFRLTLPGALLLGHVFSLWNIVAYGAGILFGMLLDRVVTPRSRSGLAAVDGDDLSREERHLSEAVNTMPAAISSGRPARFIGTPATSPAFRSALPVKRLSIPVSTGPGAAALTRTPNAAPSSAADFVRPSTACLLAVYSEAPGAPRDPWSRTG